jgi:hypothetical protein
MIKKIEEITTPVRSEDFIYIQFHQLVNLLSNKVKALDYRVEDAYKERVIENLYNTSATPFRSAEEQLGEFFKPIINSIRLFNTEVLQESEFAKSFKAQETQKLPPSIEGV